MKRLRSRCSFRAQNQFGSGYAVSLASATDHELQDGKSFGIGGLVKLEKSHAASLGAGQYLACTVVARAHRMSVWINGALVTDYWRFSSEERTRLLALWVFVSRVTKLRSICAM